MTYTFSKTNSYGTGGKVRCIEVNNGGKISISRRMPFETEEAWVLRALKEAA